MINDDVKSLLEYHGLATNKVDEILSVHFTGKKKLFDVLGLNEENNWRTEVKLPEVHEAKESVTAFLKEIEECCGDYKLMDKNAEYMMKDKAKVRVGKIFGYYFKNFYFEALQLIARYYKEVKKQELTGYNDFLKNNLVHTYALLKEAKITFKDDDIWDDKKIEAIVSKFSCFYGDFIKSKRTGYISGNPLDYLLLSGAGTTFSSCIRIGGEYFNSCLHYLHSPNTIVSYTTDDCYLATGDSAKQLKNIPDSINGSIHKKIGRSLFYLNDGLIVASRYYGSYYEPENFSFIEHIKEKMGGGFKAIAGGAGDRHFVNQNTGAYIDFGHTKIFTKDKFEKIIFTSGNCLKCGAAIGQYPTKGICKPCYEGIAMCSICGKKRGIRRSAKYGIWICEDCLKEFTACVYCGDYVKSSDLSDILHYAGCVKKYCPTCVEDTTKKCSGCGKIFRPEKTKDTLCYICKAKKAKEEELKKTILEEEEEG